MWLETWMYVHFGLSGSGAYSAFWSGIGSDIGEYVIAVSIITGVYHAVRSRNCEVHRCWRIGRHSTAANHRVCRKHHPDDHLTAKQVIEAHYAAG